MQIYKRLPKATFCSNLVFLIVIAFLITFTHSIEQQLSHVNKSKQTRRNNIINVVGYTFPLIKSADIREKNFLF